MQRLAVRSDRGLSDTGASGKHTRMEIATMPSARICNQNSARCSLQIAESLGCNLLWRSPGKLCGR